MVGSRANIGLCWLCKLKRRVNWSRKKCKHVSAFVFVCVRVPKCVLGSRVSSPFPKDSCLVSVWQSDSYSHLQTNFSCAAGLRSAKPRVLLKLVRLRDTTKWSVPLGVLLTMVHFNPLHSLYAIFLLYVLCTRIFLCCLFLWVSPVPARVPLCCPHSCCPTAWENVAPNVVGVSSQVPKKVVSLCSWLNTQVFQEARSAWPCHSTWLDSNYINSNIKEGFMVWTSYRLCGPASHQGFSLPSSPRCFPAEEIHMVAVCFLFFE